MRKKLLTILFLFSVAYGQLTPGFSGLYRFTTGASVLGKDTARFNMSATSTTVAGWTNVFGDPSTAARTATGGKSGTITFTSVQTSHWAQLGGACAAANNGINAPGTFPAAVNGQSWFQGSTTLNGSIYQVKIGGLNDAKLYTLVANGMFPTATLTDYYYEGAVTTPTAFGGNPATSNNVSQVATATSVQSSGGIIFIYFVNHPGSSFSMLGALTINEQ